jgi:mRNA interferase HigB
MFNMHIVSLKTLRTFWEKYPDSLIPLSRWYKIVERSNFDSFVELRATFPSADLVGDLVVFNIGGDRYRLITSVHFNRGKVYIRYVLTHREYERGEWKK